MKSVYQKEIKTYFNSPITYFFIVLLVAINAVLFSSRVFDITSYYTTIVNYELPIYYLIPWIVNLIPLLMFLNFNIQNKKRPDTNLYISDISSIKIIIAKILAVSTIFVIPLLIILIINIILMLTILSASAMVISIYILMILVILLVAAIASIMYTIFKSPKIALVVSLIVLNIFVILFKIITYLDNLILIPYLQGLVPVATTMILICLIVVNTIIATLILNKKRNIL